MPTGGSSGSVVPPDLDDETDDKEYVKVLDETTIHIDKVIESLRNFAKMATKSNASKGAKEVAKKLRNDGIDVNKIQDSTSDIKIIKMIAFH